MSDVTYEQDILNNLSEPFKVDEIDFRVQSINKGGYATILAYKDARADIKRLNSVMGIFGWKREHSRDNKNCTVSVFDSVNKVWISREDTGTESNTEAAKGLASDSFKRACFNFGIGLELYDYPLISIKLNQSDKKDIYGEWYLDDKGKPKPGWGLKLKEWSWHSSFLFNELVYLSARDEHGNIRYCFDKEKIDKAKLAKRLSILNDPKNLPIKDKLKEMGMKEPAQADLYCSGYDYDLDKIRKKLELKK